MSTADLPHSTPSAEGVDARGIAALLDALETDPDIRPHGLVLLRHGAVIAEGWWAPYAADRVQLLYSLSKSFTSTAAGFAHAEGLFELDTPVIDYFPEYDAEVTDPRTRRMTVRNIASMASGHAEETIDRASQAGGGDLVRGFLLTPPDAEPGTLFAYNQPCTYTLAAIVQRASGQSLIDYLRPRLFEPLGIREASWFEEPAGVDLGFSGLHATTDAVARLGQLYLQRGRWGEQQLLDADWLAEATRVQVANPGDWGPDWSQGYGLQFWMSRHGYRGDGAYGQFCIVLPEHDAVLAITSETEQMQRLLDHVWARLLPAFDGEPHPDADAALAERLASAALPVPPSAPQPVTAASAVFAVASAGRAPAGIREVRLRSEGDGWVLGLVDRAGELVVPVGIGEWVESAPDGVPIAAAGGWDGDGFAAEVLFLETPHTLHLACRADGTAQLRWLTTPLHPDRLRELRHPVG
ncbi:serine hydrolase domain-containing protein [Protaetiibacter intestinalis]|uniref:Class A beta-lactamase-related serine hydrolase n=1 Tax=Protaetiibacter intestinalis TaxID=2419774 RepID=A0A387B6W1_9MICO|nr:serine hydrolase domain-containing protein [Protaetiibacter intestinalis]AYF97488.1 class A beta-lactamase-related serine hydrolase [Protaetiibacter intestinalis]